MKLVSWNVNGLRACVGKGFLDVFETLDADVFCVQETKLQEGQITLELEGYHQYWNYAVKKGYSGTAVFTKEEPISVSYGIGRDEYDVEGRAITVEFKDYYLVNVYVPNSQRDLARLGYRLTWDLKNAKSNRGNSGFTDEERQKMTELLEAGFVDSFRHLYPQLTDHYTWWSYMSRVRERNIGWRIDYFIVQSSIADKITEAKIHSDIMGSDHCPISLEIDLS